MFGLEKKKLKTNNCGLETSRTQKECVVLLWDGVRKNPRRWKFILCQ